MVIKLDHLLFVWEFSAALTYAGINHLFQRGLITFLRKHTSRGRIYFKVKYVL